jgi:hypothetical protein
MTAKIKLNAASGGGSFSLQAPSSSANNRVMTLPDSADGTILTTTNPKAGNIIQVVSATTTTTVSNTTETFADSGLSASINISAGSKVLIMCVQTLDVQRSAVACTCAIKLLRGSTDIFAPANTKNVGLEGGGSDQRILFLPLHFSFLDTGASTGSNTYKIQGKLASDANSARVRFQDDSNPSTMTLLEVAG